MRTTKTTADFPVPISTFQEQIALLLDENEKLRRIAADLASQTKRMRRSGLGSN
jgi:hypothetical protein